MRKSIQVVTDDPDRQRFSLRVTGPVEKFATLTPSKVRLAGPVGQPLTTLVTIVPEEKYPFKIKDVQAKTGTFIRWEIQATKGQNPAGYQLKIENLKTDAGRYFDTLYLKTDSAVRPEISLRVFGHIFEEKEGIVPQAKPQATSG